jgi:hypothetical protein
MNAQKVAQIFGWVFIVVGILGFVPVAMIGGTMGMPASSLLGLFPVNLVHNLVHVGFGIWGVMAAKSADGAMQYCKIGGVIYLLLGVVGLVGSITAMLDGVVPLGGNDAFLHLALGAVLAYFGFMGSTAKATA